MNSLRGYIALLVVAVVLPGATFGLGTAWTLANDMRSEVEREAARVTDSVANDIAGHLKMMTVALKVLSQAQSLANGDVATFYDLASKLPTDIGDGVVLIAPDGRPVFNTQRPLGSPLPVPDEMHSIARAAKARQSGITNVFLGALSGRPSIAVEIPVAMHGRPFTLAFVAESATIARVVKQTHFPEGWLVGVVDGEGRFIMHGADDEKFAGALARPEVIEVARSNERSGRFQNTTYEGARLITFFSHVAGSKWTVLVGVPATALEEPLRKPLALMAAAALCALGLTSGLAYLLGKRLRRAVGSLEEAAATLGRGEVPAPLRGLVELERVSQALSEAGALIRRKEQDREHRAQVLADALDAAESANRAKSHFLASASHDLRQPVQSLFLFHELLAAQLKDQPWAPAVEKMRSGLNALKSLLDGLVDIGRLHAGLVEVKPTVFPIAATLESLQAEFAERARAAGVSLRVARSSALVRSDPAQLERLLRNLIDNALKYAPGGAVLLGCRHRGDQLRIDVIDTGPGIPQDKLDFIFEEFVQLGNPERDRSKGLGLGLAIVRRLGELLGHPITVRSRLGLGTRFSVSVPLARGNP